MKKVVKILFLLIGFFSLTKGYELVGDDKALRNIAIFEEKIFREFTLHYYHKYPEDGGKHYKYRYNLLTPLTTRLGDEARHYLVDFVKSSPPGILHYISDGSTGEEIVGILNQRVNDMFKKWFGEAKIVERLEYIPNGDYATVLYYKVHQEEHKDLVFYYYEFEILSSKIKSNYSIWSYGKNFSGDPFALLTSLVEGMFGDRKGENASFEGDSDIDSAYIGRIRDIIRGYFNASEDQMIIASKHESLPEGDKLKMFCKFKDADNSHVRLILEFILKCDGGYILDNALVMFPRERVDIVSLEFKHTITSIKEVEDESSGEVMDDVNDFK